MDVTLPRLPPNRRVGPISGGAAPPPPAARRVDAGSRGRVASAPSAFRRASVGRRRDDDGRRAHGRLVAAAGTPPPGEAEELDQDFVEGINEICNLSLKAMLGKDEEMASDVISELNDMKQYLVQEQDEGALRFLNVVQGMLQHTILKAAERLDGSYLQAFNRIANAVQGTEWRLSQQGKSAEVNDSLPKFSTWEDVLSKNKTEETDKNLGPQYPVERDYYTILGVSPEVDQAELKTAYRNLALKWHPDVSKEADAEDRFKKISIAYDILSDDTSRKLYNMHGAEGMKAYTGASSGQGNSDKAWSEFKPFKRESRKTRARDAAMNAPMHEDSTDRLAEAGDIVEYPLSDVVKNELQDGRVKGVGLLVGRNMDRGDADTLPKELLDICEIEPLRQEEADGNRWIPDELGSSAFCRLQDLKAIKVTDYDKRFDVWTIDVELSPGCGGPEIVEEIIL